jgi:hypothetical protein
MQKITRQITARRRDQRQIRSRTVPVFLTISQCRKLEHVENQPASRQSQSSPDSDGDLRMVVSSTQRSEGQRTVRETLERLDFVCPLFPHLLGLAVLVS